MRTKCEINHITGCLGPAGNVADATIWEFHVSPLCSPTCLVSETEFHVPACIVIWLGWVIVSATSLPIQVWSTLVTRLLACSLMAYIRPSELT
ncbi:uncharacterized protein UBRO_20142 [Ustilago bromivora]|uniref:Uncharacterized protein n=1 Tax=Ustilago bromivora TaxID=307758 RepID=A0A1K0GZ95_9BASI|nr:uncharacterized protein UBRO_20142 [Ustilago bromivora]